MSASSLSRMIAILTAGLFASSSPGQVSLAAARPFASNVIIPQTRSFAMGPTGVVQITQVSAQVAIIEQVATTTLDLALRNPSGSRLEAELIVPVPDGAVVRGFTFQGTAAEPTAVLLRKEEARRIYDSIVAKVRDPALLEFAGYNLIRSSVFPVEAGGSQQVRLTYEHLCPADGERIDYVLPRSESLDYTVPWQVSVQIRSKRPISTFYSPSHVLETLRRDEHAVTVRTTAAAGSEPGAFRLCYLLERGTVTASLQAYPDPKVGGGYFLLLAGLPARASSVDESDSTQVIRREVTLVLDRSGSMNGEKLEQVREAALQVLAGLDEGEAFNVILYNEAVDGFASRPVIKSESTIRQAREFIKSIQARGGTNIHDALLEALRPRPTTGMLPIVLFLTDGLPTVGQTSEAVIRDLALKANPHQRRIFTFGVGVDVNTPLLEKIASENRATATFVLPKEDVELKVAQVFRRLSGPLLADARLDICDATGSPAPGRVHDLMPARLPDLFEGDQLVLLGRYTGQEPLHFRVSGNYRGRPRTFEFSFGVDKATTRNAFVPRLWASRKIAFLVDAIRQMGADHDPLHPRPAVTADPRLRELVDEIVRLSTDFGILTEYTAFLAREGTDLSERSRVLSEAATNFGQRAIDCRTGLASVNQDNNAVFMKGQTVQNMRNSFYAQNMDRVSISSVQQVSDRAFYQKNGRWVDSRLVEQERTLQPRRIIEFGSEEFRTLVQRLASEGRAGCVSLRGDVLLEVDDEPVLVKAPALSQVR